MTASEVVSALRASSGFAHKRDIASLVGTLARALPGGRDDMTQAIAVGDDCAAIADGDGYLLFAIEGFVHEFVERLPWFAGYCGVMVNVSDIAAMGGRPIAVVDALWSDGLDRASPVLEGLAAAASRYHVPIVGGHSNARSDSAQLAVAVLGRAQRLLSSFNARPGDLLVVAVDLRGAYHEPYAYWDASSRAPAERLRTDLELLPLLAESELCDAAKDISMAGVIGTTLMLLESSGHGATIDVGAIPRPAGCDDDAALLRWLQAFPSFGFVLSVRPEHAESVVQRFRARELAAGVVGRVEHSSQVTLVHAGESSVLWDLDREPFIGATSAAPSLTLIE